MDHAPPERRDLLERCLHVSNGEVGKRGGVAGAGATLVNADFRSAGLSLPATTFGLTAFREINAEQAGPEPARPVGVIGRKLDQTERPIHGTDDNGAEG
jgi:hypothetical protein